MAIDFAANVGAPNQAVFGEPAVYRRSIAAPSEVFGDPFNIVGVFDSGHLEATILEDLPASTRQPVIGVQLDQFQVTPAQNDRVYIPSVDTTYVVRDVQPDGHGWALLRLNKVAS